MTAGAFNIGRPQPGEYAPYTIGYISLVETEDIVVTLEEQGAEAVALFSGLSEGTGNFRYAPGKWSIKELVGHVNDSERVFAYRALRFARNDRTPLSGFEQDDFIRGTNFDRRRLSDLVEEFTHIRKATVALFADLDEAEWMRRGPANNTEVSVRALAYIIAGHELHHRKILQEKYLTASQQSIA